MCGICGKLNFDPDEPVQPGLLSHMSDLIRHRGPDGAGEFLSGPIGLGHRRLSIIDLSTGDQPMSNEDATVWVAYNGEIYNFRELRAELRAKGHQFKSESDTEVIVHLYEEVGDECVGRLRGMFSFALWDEKRKHLLLARDRVGIKPLYYANTGRSLVFGSELKSILADPAVDASVNDATIARFLTYYYAPGPQTLFNGVRKLEAGHYLTVDGGSVAVRQYWDLSFGLPDERLDFPTSVARLQELLRRTVRDHMISDVPVGVLLSGGVDSTGILRYAAEAAQAAGQPLHSFTIGFDGRGVADERPYARIAAERFGTIHHETVLTAAGFRDFLPRYVWHMEEPVCEPPAVALFFVAKLAREHGVKVLLSGEGGDEAFGGYPEYRNIPLLEQMKRTLGPGRSLLKAGFGVLGAIGHTRLGRYASMVDAPLPAYYYSRTASPGTAFNSGMPRLLTDAFAARLGRSRPSDASRRFFERVRDQPHLNQLLYVDSKTWLPDDLLVKADKMTMATSVELRVPLLDHQVLEFAASLPPEFKVDGREFKRVLKAALADSVPAELLGRKKMGFPVPYDRWLRHELQDFVSDTLLAESALSSAYFSRREFESLLQSHRRGKGMAKEVFSLLILELWHQQFVGTKSQARLRDAVVAGRPAELSA